MKTTSILFFLVLFLSFDLVRLIVFPLTPVKCIDIQVLDDEACTHYNEAHKDYENHKDEGFQNKDRTSDHNRSIYQKNKDTYYAH